MPIASISFSTGELAAEAGEAQGRALMDQAIKMQALGTLFVCAVGALGTLSPPWLLRWALVLMVAAIVVAIVVGMAMAVMDAIFQAKVEKIFSNDEPKLKISEETIQLRQLGESSKR